MVNTFQLTRVVRLRLTHQEETELTERIPDCILCFLRYLLLSLWFFSLGFLGAFVS